ncbi:MAG: hypothetical protein ABI885_00685 [Gammaproteobacteria bacterium]
MFSQYRHKVSVAKAVPLLVASSLLAATGAPAAETARTPLVLTAYSNGVGGADLVQGKYDAALAEIIRFKPQMLMASSAKDTNLCVAYAATKQLTEAKTACSAALKSAKYDKLSSSRFSSGGSRENAYIAIAYTNRAVVHMLSRDQASATADLAHASALAPGADFVAKNLAAVSSARGSTIAQLEVAPSR